MYLSENLETPVWGEYEVAVCGGGIAGISAALAAARQGKKTVLLEQQYLLGGLATAGLVTIYLPLCDGMGRQISFGIAEELLRLSIRDGAEARYPENWLENKGTRTECDPRFQVQFNPHLFAIHAEALLLREGVDLLYGTRVTDVRVEDSYIRCLFVENKSGRGALWSEAWWMPRVIATWPFGQAPPPRPFWRATSFPLGIIPWERTAIG